MTKKKRFTPRRPNAPWILCVFKQKQLCQASSASHVFRQNHLIKATGCFIYRNSKFRPGGGFPKAFYVLKVVDLKVQTPQSLCFLVFVPTKRRVRVDTWKKTTLFKELDIDVSQPQNSQTSIFWKLTRVLVAVHDFSWILDAFFVGQVFTSKNVGECHSCNDMRRRII